MKRLPLALAAIFAVTAFFAVSASAANLPKPVLGAWTTSGGGFTLKNGSGKYKGAVVITNYHMNVECEGKAVQATVLGSYPLKVFTRGGFSTWGVGKNVGGEAEPMAAKVKAGGKTYNGSFNMIWYYEHPSNEVLSGSIAYGESCSVYMSFAHPK